MKCNPDFSKLNDKKFRIFADGSYNEHIKMGAIGCCFPPSFHGEKILHEYNMYSKLFQTTGSTNMEIAAIRKALDITNTLITENSFLLAYPIRVKTDSLFICQFLTKEKTYELMELDNNQINDLKEIKENIEQLSKKCNFKVSYIPRKLNFAHNCCYKLLRNKFLQIKNAGGIIE